MKSLSTPHVSRFLLFLLLLLPCLTKSQNNVTAEQLLGRWVEYSEPSADTVSYIPYKSPLAEGLPFHVKYAGITFEPNNICLHHHWQKCGNETGPDYYEGSWNVKKNAEILILTITYYQNQSQQFIVHKLNDHLLVMTRKK